MEKEEIDYNELKGRKNPKEDKDIAFNKKLNETKNETYCHFRTRKLRTN